ncbi:transcription-repair coupling factor [Lentisphaera profundi]|uniref:Transcription-repair-coupling factor n=1 Tax=Lentisphaera profundi TaxID=1658616 RepID=A0ABY7VTC9_9BACT|nr:transcription-repair coupling factor [Lentisphaera profundi]WDE97009.1 transcription-repair coupling factor [Lentisphaera profundi]
MFDSFTADFEKVLNHISPSQSLKIADLELTSLAIMSQIKNVDHAICVFETSAQAESILNELKKYQSLAQLSDIKLLHYPELNSDQVEYDIDLERSRTLNSMLESIAEKTLLLSSVASLLSAVVPPDKLNSQSVEIALKSEAFSPEILCELFTKMGFDNEVQVSLPGEFSLRGGILDVFSPDQKLPVRIEFFDNEIESLRLFDVDSQKSIAEMKSYQISPVEKTGLEDRGFLDYCRDYELIIVNDVAIEKHLQRFQSQAKQDFWGELKTSLSIHTNIDQDPESGIKDFPLVALAPIYRNSLPEVERTIQQAHQKFLLDRVKSWLDKSWQVHILCGSEAGKQRLEEVFDDKQGDNLKLYPQSLHYGFIIPEIKCAFLSEQELFGRPIEDLKDVSYSSQLQKNLEYEPELNEGDFAVHANHGICRYLGIEIKNGQEFLLLEFAEDRKLFLALDSSNLLMRYIGGKKSMPKLARLGTSFWQKSLDKAKDSARDYAAELLRLQAAREHSRGTIFSKDTHWQNLFEESFPFEETPDQLTSIEEVKADMEKPKPMDRLLCGDVGFGKTEVAMRAAFKAVMDSYQVAIIVPTTVLAQQHFHSFSKRMADYPIKIATLSRFISKKEQKKVLIAMANGEVDIVIGTHRLLQKDIIFKKLGLLVIDEEQRFGVESKESLKRMRVNVDILSMSATPIPRTLYLSMTGLRDFSTILTAPHNRKPVRTIVSKENDELIEMAISRELERGGQVYYLHNRVGTIDKVALKLKRMFPEAGILVGHGQMDEEELEMVMNEFTDGDAQILVCTTIIESGMDIRNANTMIIDRADRFGLSSLYQLRGRVGREHRQAYCYLLMPADEAIMDNAKERLSALRKHTHPGAGFKLAMRDLEIRGAGNMLGSQQSGHIAAVGFELYCQLLKKSVADLKGTVKQLTTASFNADFIHNGFQAVEGAISVALPPTYIESDDTRLEMYKRFSTMTTYQEVMNLETELKDRFGAFTEEVIAYISSQKIKFLATALGFYSAEIKKGLFYLEGADGLFRMSRKIPQIKKQGLAALKEAEQFLLNLAKRQKVKLL